MRPKASAWHVLSRLPETFHLDEQSLAMDYRPLPEVHEDAFHEIASYAFQPESGPDFDPYPEDHPTIAAYRMVYDAEPDTPTEDLAERDIRAGCGYYDFTTRIRGDWHRAGGVSAVASPPETRRQGHVAFMLDELLAEFRDEDIAFSVLWPFEYAFYRKFGWGITGDRQSLTIDPAELSSAAGDPAGELRRLDGDDWEDADRIHRERATEALAVRRTEEWWRYRVFDPPWHDVYAYGWADDSGVLQAYLTYSVKSDDEKTLVVHQMGYVDDHARRQLLRFCRDHDSQVSHVKFHDHDLSDLFESLADPRAAEVEISPGPMIRVVDVAAAVESLAVPESVTGAVSVAISDDRCAWNDGVFDLSFADGDVACEPNAGANGDDAEVELDIAAFSQLVTGCIPLARLRRMGDATVHDEGAASTLAGAYPEETTYLREGF